MAACPRCGTESPDTAKFCAECGERLAPVEAPERFRRTVTILFSDVVGSTTLGERLDPETLARVMGDYFDAVRPVVELHGGTLAKFIGDAVMAVFGLTEANEDDALRAVRSALEMRDTLAALNPELKRRYGVTLATRTGINTGPVAGAGLVPDRNFVAGDSANTAARLQTSAGENEILLGVPTFKLVRDAVEVELLPPVDAKGKSAPLTVYRLVGLVPEAERLTRGSRTPLVGRRSELAGLAREFDRCREERSCRLVTVVGQPGVGKSRLVREFVSELGAGARVLEGRCLPYGVGITYWPLAQIVRHAAAIEETDSTEAALAKLRSVAGDPDVAERVAQAIGLLERGAGGEETPWAVRRLLEAVAGSRPLVCVCDDIQWGEPPLLDLLRDVAARSEAPILLCCLARPELLEVSPEWPAIIELRPLSQSEGDLLLARALGGAALPAALRDRVAEAGAGNPLFIEQLASMLADEGLLAPGAALPEAIPVPPTLHALLTSRLERLEPGERRLLTRASVAGQTFYRGAVRQLVADSPPAQLDRTLAALVRKELIVPARSDLGSEEAFQFRHLLIRDAAYEVLTKQDRADLHERFGRWLEQVLSERPDEVEEIVGYHLEQAYDLFTQLGPLDDRGRALGDAAAERLSSAGRRAAGRGDQSAAASLLLRAAGLLPAKDSRRPGLLVELGEALRERGRYGEAQPLLAEALASAPDERVRTLAVLSQCAVQLDADPAVDVAAVEVEARRAVALFERLGDDAALATAWHVLFMAARIRCHCEAARHSARQAATHAARVGDHGWGTPLLEAWAALQGPMPTTEAIAFCHEALAALRRQPGNAAWVVAYLSPLHTMRGEFDLARRFALQSLAAMEDGSVGSLGVRAFCLGWFLEAKSGNWERAEHEVRAGYDGLATLGNTAFLSTIAAMLAHCLERLERLDEAESFNEVSIETAARDDVISQTLWRTARARVLVARGGLTEAVSLAREAVGLILETDALPYQGDALLDFADVLAAAGHREEARAAARDALGIYRRKEYTLGATRARTLLTRLEPRVWLGRR